RTSSSAQCSISTTASTSGSVPGVLPPSGWGCDKVWRAEFYCVLCESVRMNKKRRLGLLMDVKNEGKEFFGRSLHPLSDGHVATDGYMGEGEGEEHGYEGPGMGSPEDIMRYRERQERDRAEMEGERRHDHPLTEEEKASNYAHFLRQGPTSTSITGDSSSSSLTAGKMKRTDSEIQEEKSLQQMLLVKPGEEHLHKHTVNPDDVGLMLGDEENEENATEMKMLLDELGLEGVDLEGFMQHHGDVDEEHHDYISGQQGEEDEAGIRSVSAQEVIDTTVPHDSHASSGVTMGSEYYGTNHYSSLGSDTVSDFLKNRSGFIDDND
ncbi:hypothetical protein ADUPG1_001659, partial [Aduncisulcus paluster]